MSLHWIWQATGMFAVTNIDDLVVVAIFFGQALTVPGAWRRVVIGQYAAFAIILAGALVVAAGAGLLPDHLLAYLGLIPLILGLKAAWQAWRTRSSDEIKDEGAALGAPTIASVVAVTFANGGDNIGVYGPVFAHLGWLGTAVFCIVFLVLVGVWCYIGYRLARRPVVARAIAKWGHVIMPVTLIAIGLIILIAGGAFGI